MRVTRPALAILVVLVALGGPLGARTAHAFGKNKVQYESLEWAVLETPHMRVHYYAEEESLARRITAYAESVCVEYDGRFRISPKHRVPILLYSAHHLFQQTNATPELLTEATGGLTELIKGRVLIPHNGSWHRLVWVTRHELTHWYMLEKISKVMRDHRRTQGYMPPLWFTEGLAEYCGTVWDAEAEGLLQDAMLSSVALPITRSEPIWGSVLMYKEGQSFLLELARRYGDHVIFDMLDNWYRADDFETVFRITLGLKLKDVDDEWFNGLRRRYFPVVAVGKRAEDVGQRLTPHGRFNLGPRVIASSDSADTTLQFCYFRAGESGISLVIRERRRNGRWRERKLLRGGQSPAYESFHLFQNRPDASASGTIVLSSKRGGRDALYLVDARRGRVLRRLGFPNLVAIHDPSLVPGDSAVVFTGQDYGGRQDLYRARWPGGHLHLDRLTDDDFDDLEPDVSPDGRYVVFASDRCERGGDYSLFRLSLDGGIPEAVSDPDSGDDRQPVYSRDGRWIAFRSTRNGTSDLYVRPAAPSREARRVTHLLGPATDPDWLPGGRGLVFTAESGITFQTYRIGFDPDSLAAEPEHGAPRVPMIADEVYTGESQRYARRLSLDLVQNAVGVDPGLGAVGGGQIALSDVLGNEQYYLFLTNDADRFGGNFWDGFAGGVTYLNQAHRLNYGAGLFRLTQVYDADLDEVRRERRVGALLLASYPFSKFTRVEASVLARHAKDHLLRNFDVQDVDLVSNFLSLVYDNVGWTHLGPASGVRAFASAGVTRDLTSGAGDFGTLIGEARHYFAPFAGIVVASRAQGQSSLGRDAQRFYLGGRFSLRGYDRRAVAGTQTVLVQEEVRFPLVRGLVMALPAPWLFPTIQGAAFTDIAWVWEQGYYDRLASVGAGVYVLGGYYPALRWNFVWPTRDFRSFPRRPRTQVSIGFNF